MKACNLDAAESSVLGSSEDEHEDHRYYKNIKEHTNGNPQLVFDGPRSFVNFYWNFQFAIAQNK